MDQVLGLLLGLAKFEADTSGRQNRREDDQFRPEGAGHVGPLALDQLAGEQVSAQDLDLEFGLVGLGFLQTGSFLGGIEAFAAGWGRPEGRAGCVLHQIEAAAAILADRLDAGEAACQRPAINPEFPGQPRQRPFLQSL